MKRVAIPWPLGSALAIAVLLAAVYVALRGPLTHAGATAPHASLAPMAEPRSVDITPTPTVDLNADDIQSINSLIKLTPDLRNDVVFLVVAAARDRCSPAERGSLARMANRAQLPVLEGVSAATGSNPDLERPLYRYIQAAASSVDCRMPLTLAAQPPININTYAEGFPDSFHAPNRLAKPPSEYEGLSLAQRAAQPCRSVAYAVLPLGAPQWQCDSSRANARKRIVTLCEAELDRLGRTHEGELSPVIGDALAPAVAVVLGSLPAGCRGL